MRTQGDHCFASIYAFLELERLKIATNYEGCDWAMFDSSLCVRKLSQTRLPHLEGVMNLLRSGLLMRKT